MARDPVCGMEVDEETALAKYEYQGKVYYFCNQGCKRAFQENPEMFLKGEGKHHQ